MIAEKEISLEGGGGLGNVGGRWAREGKADKGRCVEGEQGEVGERRTREGVQKVASE